MPFACARAAMPAMQRFSFVGAFAYIVEHMINKQG
jgi:hypothetical protein